MPKFTANCATHHNPNGSTFAESLFGTFYPTLEKSLFSTNYATVNTAFTSTVLSADLSPLCTAFNDADGTALSCPYVDSNHAAHQSTFF